MNIGIACLCLSFIYILMTSLIYLSKKRIDNVENKIYSYMLLTSFLGIFLELGCIFAVPNMEKIGILNEIVNRLYLIYILTWCHLFTRYIFAICFYGKSKISGFFNKNRKIFDRVIFNAIYLLFALGLLLLPLEYYYDGTYVYSFGQAIDVLYAANVTFISFWVVCLLLNFKDVGIKKFIPLLTFILGATLIMIVHNINPGILVITVTQVFITVMMFYTIENPDVAMLEQVELEKERADKANQAKSDFLSSMSHEIRTPLNAIVGFSECINQSETLEEAQENAKDIMGASETLLEIVNGILDISKIESGKIELIENDYNPYKMLEETVKLARGRLAEKPLDFQVNIAQDIPKALYGDKFNIKKILINFLTNAIKYTDEGYVRFDVQCVKMFDNVRLIFSVSDSGRGIKKEDIDKLFTKFQRLDEEKNHTIEGTGLGLAITKQLIEMMKGKIIVDSVYGEGSKFTFILDQKISDAVIDDTTAKISVVADLTGKKILVVDDNKLNLKVASKLLKTYGVDITVCNSGKECIGLIEDDNKFDLILLDDMMPGMSGIETLHILKQDPNFKIPTIALTANAINGMKEKYLSEGFDDYLPKPIDKVELNNTLVRFLNPIALENAEEQAVGEEEKKENEVDSTTAEQEQQVDEQIVSNETTTNNLDPSIPKYVPDNQPIVVLPGNTQKSSEETIVDEDNKPSDKSGKILLIVDDNNLNIKVESKLITSLGYSVESANSGIEAISKVKSGKYSLIFMDIMMPMMDGVQTLHELKKIDGFSTPVVALTADAVLGAKEKYLSEGFDLYVTKPADKEELQEVLDKFNI